MNQLNSFETKYSHSYLVTDAVNGSWEKWGHPIKTTLTPWWLLCLQVNEVPLNKMGSVSASSGENIYNSETLLMTPPAIYFRKILNAYWLLKSLNDLTSFLLAVEVTKFGWPFPAWALSAHSATIVNSEVIWSHLKSVCRFMNSPMIDRADRLSPLPKIDAQTACLPAHSPV